MTNNIKVFMNGEFKQWDQAKVHLMSHSFGRGSAIFEVLSIHKTGSGVAVFRLDEHVKRLFRTAELLNMELPLTHNELLEGAINTVRYNKIEQGIVKIICFYPQISLSCDLPQEPMDVSIFVIDISKDPDEVDSPPGTITSVCIAEWRKLDPQTVPVEAKAAANYLNGIMAQEEAKKKGFEFALMLDTQGFVAECGTEAIFIVKDDCLMTPVPGTILRSITRKSILELAKVTDIKTLEGRLHPDLLFEADEIFLSNTPFKFIPVGRIEDYELGDTPGPITKKLSSLMADITIGRDERLSNWLFHV